MTDIDPNAEPVAEALAPPPAWPRILGAFGVALAFALAVYLLLEATRYDGTISFTFLLLLPATLSAFVCYVSDPRATRSIGQYLMVPFWLLLAVIVCSIFILREGTICVVLLSPLWMLSGMLGAWITHAVRRRDGVERGGYVRSSALLVLPLVAMQVEPLVPLPTAEPVVTRSIVIAAPPARIWPLLRGIPDVRPGEGAWNLSQNVLGIPRPIGARLVGGGIGADRYADWGERIKFRERITQWTPGRRIGWRFIFDDVAGWGYTDRHLMPNSRYFTVTRGGYTVEPLGGGRSRVAIDTHYRITTPVNGYSELWGQVFLGDLETNLLALVKGRAERGGPKG